MFRSTVFESEKLTKDSKATVHLDFRGSFENSSDLEGDTFLKFVLFVLEYFAHIL